MLFHLIWHRDIFSPHKYQMNNSPKPHDYGVLSIPDSVFLEKTINRVAGEFDRHITMLEVGCAGGGTMYGIKRYCDSHAIALSYDGIDGECGVPKHGLFAGSRFFCGDSSEIFETVGGVYNLIFIDACHCVNHVMLDFLNYTPKLRKHGYALYHDTNPSPTWQGCHYQGHGPKTPSFHVAVRSALTKLGLLGNKRTDWMCIDEERETSGMGMMLFKKIYECS